MRGRGLRRDPVKERFWRETLRRQQAGGFSIREFCARQGLAESAFYAWRAEIRRRDRQAPSHAAASGERSMKRRQRGARRAEGSSHPRFLPVAAAGGASGLALAAVEIALPSGVVLRVGCNCDRQMLRSVLSAALRQKAEAPPC